MVFSSENGLGGQGLLWRRDELGEDIDGKSAFGSLVGQGAQQLSREKKIGRGLQFKRDKIPHKELDCFFKIQCIELL